MKAAACMLVVLVIGAASVAYADSTSVWEGRVRMGGTMIDETGNASLMQETFNLYEGFSLSSLYLKGRSNARTHLLLDLTDVNLGDRRGLLDVRRVGSLHLRANYAENRYVFDPSGAVDARRQNLQSTLTYTPSRWLWLSGDYGLQTRSGDRIPLNPGHTGWLGNAYDSRLHRWRAEAQARAHNGIGGTFAYEGVKQTDALDLRRERTGYVASANLQLPHLLLDRVTHVLRGSVGRSELPESELGFDLLTFQYNGIVDPTRWARLKYRFYASQIDDEATRMRTDNYIHDVDASARWRMALVSLGYGWEALDDDHAVTTSETMRGSLSLKSSDNGVSGRVAYATRNTDDEEATTLLQDTEYDRFDARIDGKAGGGVTLGARAANRNRRMPDIGSEAEGWMATGYGGWRYEHFSDSGVIASDLGVEYTYADDDYTLTSGAEHVVTHALTSRINVNIHERIDLSGAVTFIEADEDLDIRKSVLSLGAGYRMDNGFSADARYGAYNYDDYLAINRFYTANVVWLNLGYSFSTE